MNHILSRVFCVETGKIMQMEKIGEKVAMQNM